MGPPSGVNHPHSWHWIKENISGKRKKGIFSDASVATENIIMIFVVFFQSKFDESLPLKLGRKGPHSHLKCSCFVQSGVITVEGFLPDLKVC